MVSLKFISQHLRKFSRFGSFIFFILLLSTFVVTSQVFAQVPGPTPGTPTPCQTNPFAPGCVNQALGVAPINDIKVLNESNNTTNGVGDTNKGSYVSNPSVWRQAGGNVTPIGGDGVLENILAGVAKNIAMYKTQTVDAQGNPVVYYSPGAIGTTINLTARVLEHGPASSMEYVAYLKDSFSHPLGVQPAYAQGLGFSSLSPVLGLWKVFRNLAYFFFVIIFLAVGFLIMFRSKIGGQTAVTVQQALPKIVVALLLVTFSYAIAGLMIDLMYLIIYLMIGLFSIGNSGQLSTSTLTSIAFEKNIFENGINFITQGVAGNVATAIGSVVVNILNFDQGVLASAQGLVQGGVSIIAFLVIAIAILVNLFRIFFALIKAYAMIFILVIFAPIQLMIGALPGQNTFSAWIRALAENLAVFPVLILLIFIANWFAFGPSFQGATGAGGIGGFSAPQLGSNQGLGAPIAFALIQFGILALIPQAMEIAKGAVSGKFNIDVGKSVGDFASKGFKGGELIPGVGFTHLGGLSQIPGYARVGSNTGKESGIERILAGSRERRLKEQQYAREIYDKTGVSIQQRRGGALGWLTNKGITKRNAAQLNTPGSGKS